MDVWNNHASNGFAGGSGTEIDPYRIETAGQLAYMAQQSRTNDFEGEFISLNANINLSGYLWNGISDFKGTFSGNNNCISNMTVIKQLSEQHLENAGFFNSISGSALVENVVMKDGKIAAYNNVGGLVGYMTGGTIKNCILDNVDVFGLADSNHNLGGIVGVCLGEMVNCLYLNGNIVGNNQVVAIIAGTITDVGSLTNCGAKNVIVKPECDNSFRGIANTYNNNANIHACYMQVSNIQDWEFYNNIYGGADDWTDWFYNVNLNDGYPIPKALLLIGSTSPQTSTQIYNRLVSLGFSAV